MTATPSYVQLAEYPEDGLREYQLCINGQPQEYKDIIRTWQDGRNECVSRVSMRYEVTPHSRIIKAANEQSALIGAVPFNEFTGPWFTHASSNVMLNKKDTAMHALYAFNEPVEITKGDKIQLGYSIHNSIDGSSNMGGGMFTFRHACKNMFMMGLNGRGMRADVRKILAYFGVRHNREYSNLEIQGMLNKLTETGMIIVGAIRKMRDLDLNEVQAERLVKILPEKEVKKLAWIDVNDKGKISMTKTIKQYEAWNVMTDLASHSQIRIEAVIARNKVIEETLLTPLLVSAQ